jgi:hypothetical protein
MTYGGGMRVADIGEVVVRHIRADDDGSGETLVRRELCVCVSVRLASISLWSMVRLPGGK